MTTNTPENFVTQQKRTLRRIRLWAACAAVVLSLLIVPIRSTIRAITAPEECRNNLKQIGLALHAYHDCYGSFPPAYVADADGKPMHSWRVLLLPFLNQATLFEDYDLSEGWDGPNNSRLAHRMPDVYSCPANGKQRRTTNYFAIVGGETAWPGRLAVRIHDIRDGTALTTQVVESVDPGVLWLEPRDMTLRQAYAGINPKHVHGISSRHGSTAHALMCNGDVRALASHIDLKVLKYLFTINSGRPFPGWNGGAVQVAAEFPPEIDASELKHTNVLPHLAGVTESGRKFLMYLQEREATDTYFALWIENAELLAKQTHDRP